MDEKTAYDILLKKLTARGLKPESQISERNFIVPGRDRMSNKKFIIASYRSVH